MGCMTNSTTPPVPHLDAEDIVNAICVRSGEGFRASLKSKIDETRTDQGRQLMLQMLCTRHGLDRGFDLGHGVSGWHEISGHQADGLADLSYVNINSISLSANPLSIDDILLHGISAERLRAINELLTRHSQTLHHGGPLAEGWAFEALLKISPDFLSGLAREEPADNLFHLYSRLVLAADPSRYSRLSLSRELGLSQRSLIEATQHPVAVLVGLRDSMPDRYKHPWFVIEAADSGHDAASIKKWGAGLAMKFSAAQLEGLPGKPAAIKSLLGRGGVTSLDQVATLVAVGFTKGGDYKALRTMMGSDASLDDLVEARDTLPVNILEEWARANRGRLTIDEVRAITALNLAGFKTAEQVMKSYGDTHHQSRPTAGTGGETSPLRLFATLATAGMTSNRLRVLARAGIPVTVAAKFQESTTEWEDGAPFREAYRANQVRQVETGWKAEIDPWEFTGATFRLGHSH